MYLGPAQRGNILPVRPRGLGGTIETGRVLNYLDKSDDDRKLCSLYLSILDRVGVKLDRFGDADARLTGL